MNIVEVKDDKIVMDKELNNLDLFTLDFIRILEKYGTYALVSGYVAILFGRSRISEDVDVFVSPLTKPAFALFYKELTSKFDCINVDDVDELFDMLSTRHSIRFARKGQIIPNVEMRFALKPLDKESLNKRIRVEIGKEALYISPIELQIAYKERVLKSPKDFEDALHLREVFKGHLDSEKIKYYERVLKLHGYQ